MVEARARLAAAQVSLAAGRPDEAAEPAREALAAFGRLGMPLHVGEARLALARALVDRPRPTSRATRRAPRWRRSASWARRGRWTPPAAVLRELGEATGARAAEPRAS